MASHNTPHNGDFASLLEGNTKNVPEPAADSAVPLAANDPAIAAQRPQTIDDVLVHGEVPTDEFLEEWNELNSLLEVSDEELARQALNAPGDDGDINTPE